MPPIPPLAVTIGDPAGIGPEIIADIMTRRGELGLPELVVIGDAQGFTPGEPTRAGAAMALESLRRGIAMVRAGEASAIVTGPVSKAAIAEIEPGFTGQTEALADACDIAREDAVMLLAGPSVKAVPMTVHCALAEVPGRLTRDLIVRRCRIVARAFATDFGIPSPRIAVAGLNPHAGEDGRMGREEIETIAPAIAQLRTEGIDATGPHPADTLFAPHRRPTYDVAVAMYHDQALAPMKALDFDTGVNMALGLPIVRTSPDHGTGFDIAGRGVARADSMIAAIRLAAQAVAHRSNVR